MRCLMRLHLTCVFVRFADYDTSLFSRVLTVVTYPSFTTVYLVRISCVLYTIVLVCILFSIILLSFSVSFIITVIDYCITSFLH